MQMGLNMHLEEEGGFVALVLEFGEGVVFLALILRFEEGFRVLRLHNPGV